MSEVDHRSTPGELRGDCDHVVERPEPAHATHDLDAERHAAPLGLEALAQLAELLHHRLRRLRVLTAQQEAGVEDDELGPALAGYPSRMVEHPHSHPVLLVSLAV